MSLLPISHRGFNRVFDEVSRDLDHFDRFFGPSYWLRAKDNLDVGSTTTELVNNNEKFGVTLDVSHFKPEELKVHLDGHVLTVEGHHELKDEHSHLTRSFTRKWTLPTDVDLEMVRTALDKKGHLAIDAPKKHAKKGVKAIPIEHK